MKIQNFNVGKIIKIAAVVFAAVGVLTSVIAGIRVFCALTELFKFFSSFMASVIVVSVGSTTSCFMGLIAFAIGELVDNTAGIKKLLESTAQEKE